MINQNFYTNVTPAIRGIIDAQTGGEFVIKHEDEAYELLEKIAKNSHLWSSPRGSTPTQKRQVAGMYELDPFNMINAKFDALTNVLAKKMEDLSMLVSSSSCSGSSQQVTYAEGTMSCGVDYPSYAWRNHPNFSWENQQNQASTQNFPSQQQEHQYQQPRQPPPSFQQKNANTAPLPRQQEQSSTTEALLQQILANQIKRDEELREMKARLEQMQTHNRMLENQIAQQACSSSTNSMGKLPSQTENPREQCHAITLRSGKIVHNEKSEKVEREKMRKILREMKNKRVKKGVQEKVKRRLERKKRNIYLQSLTSHSFPFHRDFKKPSLISNLGSS